MRDTAGCTELLVKPQKGARAFVPRVIEDLCHELFETYSCADRRRTVCMGFDNFPTVATSLAPGPTHALTRLGQVSTSAASVALDTPKICHLSSHGARASFLVDLLKSTRVSKQNALACSCDH